MVRSVVVLPQPDGPSRVVKLPRGMSSDTSSMAGCGALPKRLTRWTRRTCGSSIRDLVQDDASAADCPQQEQNGDRAGDDGDGERGRAAPVEVVDELEDANRGRRGARCEQKNDHRERGDRAHEGGH